MRADLNVIDFERLRARRRSWPTTCRPAASASCRAHAGYRATVVTGEITYRDGEATGALPGAPGPGGRYTARTPLAS